VKQLTMLKKPKTEFGGSLESKGKRKTERPLDRNRPMHFVLKSNKAIVLIRNQRSLRKIIGKQAGTFGIKIYSETVQKDHWHIVLRITNRRLYRGFIRALTGLVARLLGKGVWRLRPYSRLVNWGRDFGQVSDYLLLNECEVAGIVPYAIRKRLGLQRRISL
jgi:REP element-mobilizing transposase RayT